MESESRLQASVDMDGFDFDTGEEILLYHSRRGNLNVVEKLLQLKAAGEIELDVNCKGTHKSNFSWTPLHLASYFGHEKVVSELLKYRQFVNINVQNDHGDTPLHKAAYTGRFEVVQALWNAGADCFIRNSEGLMAKDLTRSKEIRDLLIAAEECDMRLRERALWSAATTGNLNELKRILSDRVSPVDIDCRDSHTGNTALHYSSHRGHIHCVAHLLSKGADVGIKNFRGLTPADLAPNKELQQLLINHARAMHLASLTSDLNMSEDWFSISNRHIVSSSPIANTERPSVSSNPSSTEKINRTGSRQSLTNMEQAIHTAQAHFQILERQVKVLLKIAGHELNVMPASATINEYDSPSKWSRSNSASSSRDSESSKEHVTNKSRDSLASRQPLNMRNSKSRSQNLDKLLSDEPTMQTIKFHLSLILESSSNTCEAMNECLELMREQTGVGNLKSLADEFSLENQDEEVRNSTFKSKYGENQTGRNKTLDGNQFHSQYHLTPIRQPTHYNAETSVQKYSKEPRQRRKSL